MANAVGETAPHPLDTAFGGADVKATNEGLLNNSHFKNAVTKAVQAYKEAQNRPEGIMAPSPSHAARAAFLEAIA